METAQGLVVGQEREAALGPEQEREAAPGGYGTEMVPDPEQGLEQRTESVAESVYLQPREELRSAQDPVLCPLLAKGLRPLVVGMVQEPSEALHDGLL